MLPTGLFSSRLFSVLNLFTVVVYAALGGFTFFFAVYLQNVVGWSAFRTGVALLPMTLLLLVGSARAGALSARIGPRLPLTVGPVVSAVGLLLLRGVGPRCVVLATCCPGCCSSVIGLTLVVAPLTASVLAAVAGPVRRGGQRLQQRRVPGRRPARGGGAAAAGRPLRQRVRAEGRVDRRVPGCDGVVRRAARWPARCWPSCWSTDRPGRARGRSPAVVPSPPDRAAGRRTGDPPS